MKTYERNELLECVRAHLNTVGLRSSHVPYMLHEYSRIIEMLMGRACAILNEMAVDDRAAHEAKERAFDIFIKCLNRAYKNDGAGLNSIRFRTEEVDD